MKVFWLAKFTGEKPLTLYRTFLESDNLFSSNIEETLPFRYVEINNPINSSLVYTISNLYLKPYECTELKLFMTDNVSCSSNNNLEIKHLYEDNNISHMTQLSTNTSASNLLTNHYVIIIPGGSLIIKTNTPILNAKLSMNYTTEEL
ncbi:hypothetical protein [Candidatus Clostridium radicumherbarum]|uniref:Uncharacterized protein n=1 Tax=Candidatus Clostridium radicumherbarum TaxID=3381662 RepID=A0ABW8TYV8_9CLOT